MDASVSMSWVSSNLGAGDFDLERVPWVCTQLVFLSPFVPAVVDGLLLPLVAPVAAPARDSQGQYHGHIKNAAVVLVLVMAMVPALRYLTVPLRPRAFFLHTRPNVYT